MKSNDILKAISTCESKYIASISHKRMYFTNDKEEAFCETQLMSKFLNIKSIAKEIDDTKDIVTVVDENGEIKLHVLDWQTAEEIEQEKEAEFDDLIGLNENDIY